MQNTVLTKNAFENVFLPNGRHFIQPLCAKCTQVHVRLQFFLIYAASLVRRSWWFCYYWHIEFISHLNAVTCSRQRIKNLHTYCMVNSSFHPSVRLSVYRFHPLHNVSIYMFPVFRLAMHHWLTQCIVPKIKILLSGSFKFYGLCSTKDKGNYLFRGLNMDWGAWPPSLRSSPVNQ